MNNFKIKKISLCVALAISAMGAPVFAKTDMGLVGACRVSPLVDYVQPQTSTNKDETIYISSSYADTDELFSNLRGDIVLYRGDEKTVADNLVLDRTTNVLSGDNQLVRYATPTSVVEGQSILSYLNEKKQITTDAVYYFHDMEAQGKAVKISSDQNARQAVLEDSSYSTCPVGQEAWGVRSKNLVLDEPSGRGVARNATFSLFGMPVLYTPYMSFPIDDRRQSGFLFPMISMDKNGGFSVRTPYYLNIAPNFDMTITPGFFTKRGVILGTEMRYLTPSQHSVLSFEFLPSDRAFRRKESMRVKEAIDSAIEVGRIPNYRKARDDDRWSLFFEQYATITPKLTGHILFQQTSDEDYVKDLDDAIGLLSKTNLERFAKFTYEEDNWSAMLNFQHFQILDREVIRDDPYARMPQLTFSGNWETAYGLNYGIDAEAVRFTTNVNEHNLYRVKRGDRLDVTPYMSFRFENSWGYFEPRAALRFTAHSVKYKQFNKLAIDADEFAEIKAINDTIRNKPRYYNRTLPIFSIDTGMFFERETQFSNLFGGGEFIQTLEPRLFYLYVPYRKQSHIPILDSGAINPGFNELFSYNEFRGADRQSNANQVTLALTSRFLNAETGVEKFRLSVGQIRYFTEPLITLGNDREKYVDCVRSKFFEEGNADKICNRDRQSEWFVENEMAITDTIHSKLTWQWSPDIKKTTRLALDLRYQPTARQVFNIGHRFSRDVKNPESKTHQIDLTTFWEVTNNWSAVARYNYSLESHRLSDSYVGFEYNDCCITTRIAARYYREHLYNKEKQWKAYFQVELKGLGNFGQDTMALWADTITGYNPR